MASDDESTYGTIWTACSSKSEINHLHRAPSEARGLDESIRPSEDMQDSNDTEYVEITIAQPQEPDLQSKCAFQPALTLEDYEGIDVYSVNGPPSTFDPTTLPIVHRDFKSREPLRVSSPLAAVRSDLASFALSSAKPLAASENSQTNLAFKSNSRAENANESESGYEDVGALLRGTTFNAYNTVLFVSAADWSVTPILDFSSSCFQPAYQSDSPSTKAKPRRVYRRGHSAIADAVMQHRLEIANPGGVLVRMQRQDLQTRVAIVELCGVLYCVGCDGATARIHRAFRCGDQLMELNGSAAACRSLSTFHEALQSGPDETSVRIRRTPFAKSFIVRIGPDENLAAYLKPGSPTIRTVPYQSPIGRASLNPRAEPCICSNSAATASTSTCVGRWRISEINGRPVHLFATKRDVEPLLRFPPALLQSKVAELNKKSKRSQFDTLPSRGRADSESMLQQVELAFQTDAPRKIIPHRSVSVSVSAAALSSMQSLAAASMSLASSNDSLEHKDDKSATQSDCRPGRIIEIALVVQPYCLIKNFKKQVAKSKQLRSILYSV